MENEQKMSERLLTVGEMDIIMQEVKDPCVRCLYYGINFEHNDEIDKSIESHFTCRIGGPCEDKTNYENKVKQLIETDTIEYHRIVDALRKLYIEIHRMEGMISSNLDKLPEPLRIYMEEERDLKG